MSNSFANKVELMCSKCQQAFSADVWLIVDANDRPDLIDKICAGKLHDIPCPHCGVANPVDAPLLLFRANGTPALFYSPGRNTSPEQNRAQGMLLVEILRKQLGTAWKSEWTAGGLIGLNRDAMPTIIRKEWSQLDAFQAIMEARSLSEILRTVQLYPLLLDDVTHQTMHNVIDRSRREGSEQLAQRMEKRLEILVKLKADGISLENQASFVQAKTAIQDQDSEGPSSVLAEVMHLESPADLPRKIALCDQALQLVMRESNPGVWAALHTELGISLHHASLGNRADNLESAINHHEQALEVFSYEAFPEQWASTQNNLATVLTDRICGERADNIERAIRYYEQSLLVYVPERFLRDWAITQMNLGNAYADRIHGKGVENIERAIEYFKQALSVLTPEEDPELWIMAQADLGNSYLDRIHGDIAENVEQAIYHYQRAQTFSAEKVSLEHWAMLHNNLGSAYLKRVNGEKSQNIACAIGYFEQALKVRTCEAFPIDWALIQHNLGNAYSNYSSTESGENIKQAISHYNKALQVRTRWAMPAAHRQTQGTLGNLYLREHRWHNALASFVAAIQAGEDLFAAAYSETGRRAETAEASELYTLAAYCLIQLHHPVDALMQLEAGKTRLLTQVLALAEVDDKNLSGEDKNALSAKCQTIRELEMEMRLLRDKPAHRADRDLAGLVRLARAELKTLIDEIRKEHPDFIPLGLSFSEILALVPEDGAIVAPVVTSQGSAVFVVPHGTQTVDASDIVVLDDFKDESLDALLIGAEDNPGWIRAYIAHRATNGWQPQVDQFTSQLWDKFISPIQARLQTQGVKRVVLMPSGGLQLLPLHAAWRMENGVKRYWLDDYEISYAPSAYALGASQKRAGERTGQSALVAGVSEYKKLSQLHYTRAEVEEVGKLFNSQTLLNDTATPNAIVDGARDKAFLHLSCHGSFAWGEDALASALYLANDERLTLGDILGKMDLNAARLVTLSACETGITDVRQSPDEYVGLPAGFLQAGAAGVVSSLWSVDDMSTALLMIQFYENHLKQKQSPSEALRNAQLWLRDVTNAELADLFAQYKMNAGDATTRMAYATAQERFREHTLAEPNAKPFEHPYYWAAFAFYGA
jgi:CHAT domain-containing protein